MSAGLADHWNTAFVRSGKVSGRLPDDGQTDRRHFCKSNENKPTFIATMRAGAISTPVLLLALVAITLNRVGAYPIIAEIDEDDETVSHQE